MRSKKAVLNIITNLLLQIIVVVYGFIVPKIIMEHFGSNVNGLVSSITQFLGYIVLLESGFGPVVKSILYKPIAKKDFKTIQSILYSTENFFKKISYIFLIYIFVLSLVYPLMINTDYDFIFTFSLLIIISISTFAEYYFGMAYNLYLQANQKGYIINTIQIITYLLNIVFILVLAQFNASIHLIKLFSCFVFALRPIFQNIYVKRKYNINFENVDKNYKIPNKWDGLAQHVAGVIHANTDIAILTIFSTLVEVSVYSIYYMIIKAIKKIIMVFSTSVSPGFGDMIARNESKNLNEKFSLYLVGYNTILTIIFSCSIILIVPFVSIYTYKITDANYIRYTFAYLLIISEYIAMIRLPYMDLSYVAGHFKQTRRGAWIECIVNIMVSILLVKKFGLVGVTIGTIVAMSIRTIEFIYHTNKYILHTSYINSLVHIILIVLETLIIVIICNHINFVQYTSYFNWICNAFIVFFISCFVTIMINIIIYNKKFLELLNIIKNLKNKRRRKK